MASFHTKLLISPLRPQGVPGATKLGRIIAKLDQAAIAYRLPVAGENGTYISGTGTMRVEKRDDRTIFARVSGDVFRPSSFEYSFHAFWLTRRGMILLVIGLITDQSEAAADIKLRGNPNRELKEAAKHWLRRRRVPETPLQEALQAEAFRQNQRKFSKSKIGA